MVVGLHSYIMVIGNKSLAKLLDTALKCDLLESNSLEIQTIFMISRYNIS